MKVGDKIRFKGLVQDDDIRTLLALVQSVNGTTYAVYSRPTFPSVIEHHPATMFEVVPPPKAVPGRLYRGTGKNGFGGYWFGTEDGQVMGTISWTVCPFDPTAVEEVRNVGC